MNRFNQHGSRTPIGQARPQRGGLILEVEDLGGGK
jgi:hypothetical protein